MVQNNVNISEGGGGRGRDNGKGYKWGGDKIIQKKKIGLIWDHTGL